MSEFSSDYGEHFYQNIKPRFDVDYNWEVGHEHQSIFSLSNDCVEHLSRFEWKVGTLNERRCFMVKRLIGDGEDEVDMHREDCDFWEDSCDPEHICFDKFCRECDICCHMYSCECQIRGRGSSTDDICWHIHKVHMWTLEYIQKQRPRNLKDTINGDCVLLMKKAKAMDLDAKVALAQELNNVIKNFNAD